MSKLINWKSDWFNGNFKLFVDGLQKGVITFGVWTGSAEGMFEDQNYQFVNDGFWQSKTRIIDRKTNEAVAFITYDCWKSKAVISLSSGEQYEWKATGFWKSKWTLSNYKDEHIMYTSGSNSGSISSDTDNKLLVIAGLFIKQTYNRQAFFLMMCLIPAITSSTLRHH